MKLLADEDVDGSIVARLRQDGHEVDYVAEMKRGVSDEEILRDANQNQALVSEAMKRIIAFVLFVLCAACAHIAERPSPVSLQEITNQQAKNLLQRKEVRVIDVRSGNERLTGKVPGAVELLFGPIQWTERPVASEEINSFLREIREKFVEKDIGLIIFCNVGIRSQAARQVLIEDGYTNVMTVREGFLGNRFGEGLQAQLFRNE